LVVGLLFIEFHRSISWTKSSKSLSTFMNVLVYVHMQV